MMGLFALLFIGFLLLDIVTFVQTNIVDNQLEDLSEANLPLFQSMENLKVLELEQETIMLQSVVGVSLANSGSIPDGIQMAVDLNDRLEAINSEVTEEYENAKVYAQLAIDRAESIGNQDFINEYNEIYHHLESLELMHVALNDGLINITNELRSNPSQALLMEGSILIQEDAKILQDDLDSFVAHVNELVNDNVSGIHLVQNTANNVIVAITNILFVVAIVVLIIINRIVLRPLTKFRQEMEEISTGDFTVEIDSKLLKRKDEIGDVAIALNHLKDNVGELLHKVRNASESVASSSTSLAEVTEQSSYAMNEITEAMSQIADTSQEQTNEASLVVDKTNDLGDQIQDSETQIYAVQEYSHETNEMSIKGLDIIAELNEKTARSNESADEISIMTNEIHKSASDAEQITDIIEAISSQTNLLALNASIEAARAGESGRGFAVVADEIRKLSEETSSATEDIKQLIGDIQNKSTQAVEMMNQIQEIFDDQNVSIEATSDIFKETSRALSSLNEKIDVVRSNSAKINNNKDEIVHSIQEISKSIEDNSSSVQQASASTEEQMASIEELSMTAQISKELSDDLIDAIDKFKI
jgi:methyl-accepting chemotaxis protein